MRKHWCRLWSWRPPARGPADVEVYVQPDKDRNGATYRPLANYLSARLDRPVELRTVDSWEGLAKSLASAETDIALMGPWGYVLANNEAGAQVGSAIL